MPNQPVIDLDEIIELTYSRLSSQLLHSLFDKDKTDLFIRKTIEDILIEYGVEVSLHEIKFTFDYALGHLQVSVEPKENHDSV